MATQLQPEVDDLFDLFDRTLGGFDNSVSILDSLDRSFREIFNLPLKGVWIENDGDWQSLETSETSPDVQPLSIGRFKTRTDALQENGLHWLPVRDRAGLIGLLAFDVPSDVEPRFLSVKTIAPFLFSYLHRNHEFESVSGQELFDVESKFSPSLEELSTPEGIEEVLRSIALSFHDVFDCDNCRIFWRDSPEILRLRIETGSSEDVDSTIQIDDDPVIQHVIEEEKSVIINDLPEERDSTQITGAIRSFMAVPFRYEDRVLGTINLSSENPDVFTKEDLQRFSSLTDKLASIFAVTQDYVNLTSYVEEILTNLPVGVLNLRIDNDEIHLNKKAREIFSIDRDRMSRSSFRDHLMDKFGSEEFLDLLEITQSETDNRPKKIELVDESSNRIIVKAMRTLVRNTEDVLSSILVVISDVTEQEELSEQVNRAERLAALGELASGLAHEIKNPLTSIHGFVQMMPDRVDDQEFIEKTADILDRECSRLNSFIDNLLSFARPQVGHRTRFDFEELLEDLKMLISKRLDKNDITLEVELSDNFEIYGDPSKLQQVLMNLCLNSVEAIKGGGKITIGAWNDENNSAVVEVLDDGTGMSQEQIDRIFNPFYTTKDEGTGLGMALSHRIVEEHGGHMFVESEPGEGTETTIVLPSEERSKRIHNEVDNSE